MDLHIINVEWSNISKLLDLGRALLALGVRHVKIELLYSALDGVPASQPRCEVDIASDTEVGWVDNLVCARVVENGLGVDTGLVGEGAETGDVVVEWNVDLHSLGDQVLKILQLVELVLAQDIVTVGNDHAGHKTSKRSDTIALANTKDASVDMRSTGLESTVCVGNGTASVVVEVGLDIAGHNAAESSDQIVDLSGAGTAYGIGNTLVYM